MPGGPSAHRDLSQNCNISAEYLIEINFALFGPEETSGDGTKRPQLVPSGVE
jgi:hypothetical protein